MFNNQFIFPFVFLLIRCTALMEILLFDEMNYDQVRLFRRHFTR